MHESSKIFVEHGLHVARIKLQTQAWYSGLCYEHRFINQRMECQLNAGSGPGSGSIFFF